MPVDSWPRQIGRTGWGIPTGPDSGLFCLDLDSYKGETPAEVEVLIGTTEQTASVSGGTHLWFQWAPGVTNAGGWPGVVDVRGDGGYVAEFHTLPEPSKCAKAPQWLLDRLRAAAAATPPVQTEELPECPAKLPPLPGGDVAARFRTRGVDRSAEIAFLTNCLHRDGWTPAEIFWTLKGSPNAERFDTDAALWADVQRVIAKAPVPEPAQVAGESDPEFTKMVDFEFLRLKAHKLAEVRLAAEGAPPLRVLSWDDLTSRAGVDWLVENLLPVGGTGYLVGKRNVGKTFVYVDMVMHLLLGLEWHGHATRESKVLLVLGEGLPGFGARLTAWCDAHGVPMDRVRDRVQFIDGANLMNDQWRDAAAKLAEDFAPDLIVFDTFAQTSGLSDENDAALMSLVQNRAKTIHPGSALLFIAHPNRGTQDGTAPVLRGSGAADGGVDLVLTVWRDKDFRPATGHPVEGGYLALSTEDEHAGKVRDAQTQTLRGFYLLPHGGSVVLAREGRRAPSERDALIEKHLTSPMTAKEFAAAVNRPVDTVKDWFKNHPKVNKAAERRRNAVVYVLGA